MTRLRRGHRRRSIPIARIKIRVFKFAACIDQVGPQQYKLNNRVAGENDYHTDYRSFQDGFAFFHILRAATGQQKNKTAIDKGKQRQWSGQAENYFWNINGDAHKIVDRTVLFIGRPRRICAPKPIN